MKKIEVNEDQLLLAYANATKKEQELLETLYGKETFIKPPSPSPPGLPTTWEEICKLKNIDPVSSLPYTNPANEVQKWLNAAFILYTIREVLNTDSSGKVWAPDWNNDKEYKYWPWFGYASEVGFWFYDTDCAYTYTTVGSRLCFMTSELAEHACNAFIKYYRDFLML